VILNDKLREIYGNLSIGNAFGQADNILTTAAKGIAEIITVAGYVNVDFQDVRTVMHNAGAAVMGSAQTKGENRARKAAEEALSSPLLDNRDIMGAQKILLSIISGEQAELQMDELTEITEYIQVEAGDDAEVIFGHGVDPELDDYIRVTVIATGFDHEQTSLKSTETRTVHDLEKPKPEKQTELFDNPNQQDEITLKEKDNDIPDDRTFTFDLPVRREIEPEVTSETAEEGEDDLFAEEDTDFEMNDIPAEEQEDFFMNNGMMDINKTKDRLQEEANSRIEKLRNSGRVEMRPDEFKERLDVPAYLRKQVRLQSVPPSSEPHVSKYNLNDDNQILGNNRFLHDNVD
jgi:cell division protein FtsZ